MSRWFRFYDNALDDPKVQSLPGDLFKTWVNLLCIASKNDGRLPVGDIAFMLRVDQKRADSAIHELTRRGLLDVTDNGPEPHNWRVRQHKSDVSNDRVKRFRERKSNGAGNVTSAVTETSPDTETDTEERQKGDRGADAPTDMAFVGRTIRLKSDQYERWRIAYHAIPDFVAELTKADDFYSENKPPDGKWFFPVSRWLEKVHRETLAKRADPDAAIYRGVI